MKKQLFGILDRMEIRRKTIISELDSLTEEQRNYNPESGKWNMLQVVQHLVLSEKRSLIYMKRKMAVHQDIPKTGIGSAVRFLILQISMKLPVKFKAPKTVDTTNTSLDYRKVKSEWEKIRTGLAQLVEEADEEALKKGVFKHPRAGVLNMKQALKFMEIHTARHHKQVEQIMNLDSFPAHTKSMPQIRTS